MPLPLIYSKTLLYNSSPYLLYHHFSFTSGFFHQYLNILQCYPLQNREAKNPVTSFPLYHRPIFLLSFIANSFDKWISCPHSFCLFSLTPLDSGFYPRLSLKQFLTKSPTTSISSSLMAGVFLLIHQQHLAR